MHGGRATSRQEARARAKERYLRAFTRPRLRRALSLISLPVARQINTLHASEFESARMVRMAFFYLFNEGIEGDYLEFGVYRGRTFVEAWHAADDFGIDAMQLVAFDSFSGLPKPGPGDKGGPFFEGQFATSRDSFETTLRRHHVPPDRTRIVEGVFDDTLGSSRRAELPSRVAFAWVDCDLYQSTVPVLDYLTDVLVDGAVLAFDDWFTHRGRPDRGEQRACAEWLDANPQLRLTPYRDFHWGGRSFLVHRSDSEGENDEPPGS